MEFDFELERRRVAAAVRLLERRLDRLATALLHCDGRFSVAERTTSAARRIADAYAGIDHSPGAEDAGSPTCLGVALVPPYVAALADSANAAKAGLKAVCAPLQHIRKRVHERRSKSAGTVPVVVIRLILRSLGRSELNLLAAYRKIPVLDSAPIRICYTRAFTRSVYRMPVAHIAGMIEQSERPGAKDDRARLVRLPKTEKHLALVRARYENVRANVVFAGVDADKGRRKQVGAELPLLIAAARSATLPEIDYSAALRKSVPRQRRAARLQASRFLASMPVYRYRTKGA